MTLALASCGGPEAYAFLDDGPPIRPEFVADVDEALQVWSVMMPAVRTASTRHLGDRYVSHSPANWVVVSDQRCGGLGVPQDLVEDCPLVGNTIGMCHYRYDTNGEIVDATLLIREDYQRSAAKAADKRSVLVHEIGHCLGLQHIEDRDFVMYPSTAGADAPNALELEAVASLVTRGRVDGHEELFASTSRGLRVHQRGGVIQLYTPALPEGIDAVAPVEEEPDDDAADASQDDDASLARDGAPSSPSPLAAGVAPAPTPAAAWEPQRRFDAPLVTVSYPITLPTR